MHLGNGAITPECALLTIGGAAAGLAAAAVSLRKLESPRGKLLLAGGLGALIFAAQAINVPVWPGISGHLVGGVLLAWALGPGLGAWTMALILAVQALWLGDGGLTALGANILNMALLPAGLVAIATHMLSKNAEQSWVWPGVMAAISVPLAALLIVGETALFRSSAELSGWTSFAGRMLATHLWIGLAEGGLTVALAAALVAILSHARAKRASGEFSQSAWQPVAVCLAAAAVLAVLTNWSSELPDGYEAAAERSGFTQVLQ
jgi:cobalt/nickel transport system permease protein